MMHCISPTFLDDQLDRSRQNLQLETIDLLYLHNPEAQVSYVGREIVIERITKAIEFLEEAASDGLIRRYGISTWTGFRVPGDESNHLELAEIVSMAESVAGSKHHFRAIQLPYNPAMPGAAFSMTQEVYGNSVSILEAAHELGIDVTVASPLMQGHLASELPQSFHHAFPRFSADAQRAIDFEVSTPWVTSVIVGMKEKEHIEENCRIMLDPALTSLQWAAEVDQLQDS
jgi:aryl-alcohol dehydrogenase-like predicted oxidoreductase